MTLPLAVEEKTLGNRLKNGCLVAMLPLGLLAACEQTVRPANDYRQGSSTLVPRSVAALSNQGNLQLEFTVNDVQVYQGLWTPGFSSALQADARLLTQDANKIDIIFSFEVAANSQPIRLATATHLLPAVTAGSTITFPAIVYRYEDSDGDGRYNVHELAVINPDVDGDGQPNVNDTDSDNDGIDDGLDESPYGQLSENALSESTRQVDVQLPDGSTRILSIDHIVGDPEEVSHLVDTLGQIRLQVPDDWPTAVGDVVQLEADLSANDNLSENTILRGWTAFSLGGPDRSVCPDWRFLFDASSLANNTTQPVLLYFRLDDQQPLLIPLGATSINDLDVYDHAPPFDGNGPLNNSLRLILVPSSTLGWLELWTMRALTGTVCNVNLATG